MNKTSFSKKESGYLLSVMIFAKHWISIFCCDLIVVWKIDYFSRILEDQE